MSDGSHAGTQRSQGRGVTALVLLNAVEMPAVVSWDGEGSGRVDERAVKCGRRLGLRAWC